MSYSLEKKIIDAHSPRFPGSTALEQDSSALKLVYNKFTTTASTSATAGKTRINLVFSHGTGMNKDLWTYHAKRLYATASAGPGWYLGSVVAFDAVGHGDSAVANRDKLGWTYGWTDGARDLIKIVRHENTTCGDMLNNATSKNIIVGHSLGGFHVLMAGFFEPNLFDTIVPIEAVFYYDASLAPRYHKVFQKVSSLIMDEFESLEEFTEYYAEFSFYKSLHPEVLKEMISNEYYTVYDAASGTTKYRSKANRVGQISTYVCATFGLQLSHTVVPLIDTKICFIVGEKATWNPPASTEYFINNAKPSSLIEHHIIKDGTHLVNGEQPDKIVEILANLCGKRAAEAQRAYHELPEVVYHGDKRKVVEKQFDMVLNGEPADSVGWSYGGSYKL